ncbi:non-heme iron oxygenase ferredoxin subunit [Roseobacter sp. EG26]|uniref:non-heme iron oxygenase ferredoxin subunit n=1 Tax=Roseobacter sp. EG26 TaxID=3412477 RepID=UPI003CE5B777
METLIRACSVSDIEEEDVLRFDHGDRTFAIIRSPEGEFYATDGLCTHEKAHLAEGVVDNHDIECPLHFGTFDYRTGDPTGAPACVKLKIYQVKLQGNDVYISLT